MVLVHNHANCPQNNGKAGSHDNLAKAVPELIDALLTYIFFYFPDQFIHCLFPLDGAWRLAGDVVDHPVDALDLVNNTI